MEDEQLSQKSFFSLWSLSKLELEKSILLEQSSIFKLVLNIGAFIASAMAEGTRFTKIDDAIRSLNEFRKEAETQIRDLNNTISRFIQAVDQRLEDRGESVRHSEEPVVNTPHHNNNQCRSMKIEVPRFDGTDVSGWIFKIEQFFQFYNTPDDQQILISSFSFGWSCFELV